MLSLDDLKNVWERVATFEVTTPMSEMLQLYRELEQESRSNQKTMDINSPYGTIFTITSLQLLEKIRDRIHAETSVIEGEGMLPQLKETLNEIRANQQKTGSLIWLENTSSVWRSYNPVNWKARSDVEYDPDGDDYFESRESFDNEICDPVVWKYRREAIPAAVFKGQLPELQVSLITDLRNLFGLGYYHYVVILARTALEASLKEKLGIDGYLGLGDDKSRGSEGLISLYVKQNSNRPNINRIKKLMNDIREQGNHAVHAVVHMKKLRDEETKARDVIVKLIFCLENIYQ